MSRSISVDLDRSIERSTERSISVDLGRSRSIDRSIEIDRSEIDLDRSEIDLDRSRSRSAEAPDHSESPREAASSSLAPPVCSRGFFFSLSPSSSPSSFCGPLASSQDVHPVAEHLMDLFQLPRQPSRARSRARASARAGINNDTTMVVVVVRLWAVEGRSHSLCSTRATHTLPHLDDGPIAPVGCHRASYGAIWCHRADDGPRASVGCHRAS